MIIPMPGNPLGHAGVAAAGAVRGEAQFRQQLATVHLRQQQLAQREGVAQARLMQGQEQDRVKQFEALQRGLQQSMNLASEIGVDTTMGGFRRLDAELAEGNPELHRQLVETYGLPESDTAAGYPLAFNSRAKAVQQLRLERSLEAKSAMVAEFESSLPEDGSGDAVAGDLRAMAADPDVPALELQLEREKFEREFDERSLRAETLERGRLDALALIPEITDIEDSPEARRAAGRLINMKSKDPKEDLFTLTTAAKGYQKVVEKLKAEAFMAGQEQTRFEQMRERGKLVAESGRLNRDLGIGTEGNEPVKLSEFPSLARLVAPVEDDVYSAVLDRAEAEGVSLEDDDALDELVADEMANRRASGQFRPAKGDLVTRIPREGPSPWTN